MLTKWSARAKPGEVWSFTTVEKTRHKNNIEGILTGPGRFHESAPEPLKFSQVYLLAADDVIVKSRLADYPQEREQSIVRRPIFRHSALPTPPVLPALNPTRGRIIIKAGLQ
jgi:hypothetical protein